MRNQPGSVGTRILHDRAALQRARRAYVKAVSALGDNAARHREVLYMLNAVAGEQSVSGSKRPEWVDSFLVDTAADLAQIVGDTTRLSRHSAPIGVSHDGLVLERLPSGDYAWLRAEA